jgi:hypothetical protein
VPLSPTDSADEAFLLPHSRLRNELEKELRAERGARIKDERRSLSTPEQTESDLVMSASEHIGEGRNTVGPKKTGPYRSAEGSKQDRYIGGNALEATGYVTEDLGVRTLAACGLLSRFPRPVLLKVK